MRAIIVYISISFFSLCLSAQSVRVVKIPELKEAYTHANDTTYVINFFATWCGPCMMEMPVFNAFYEQHKETKVQLLLVSLDNPKAASKLLAAVKRAGIQAPVLLLDESNDFSWLPKVDKRWGGSIPATMIINGEKHINEFLETPMEKGDLEKYLKQFGL